MTALLEASAMSASEPAPPPRFPAPPPDTLRARFTRRKHRLIVRAAVPFSRWFGHRVDGAFGILMYHRVTPTIPGLPAPTYNVSPDRFRAQLAGLLARGFIAWPLRQALEAARGGRPIPPRVFVVTFDDGYENTYRHAWPVLCDLGVPATIFLPTAYLDSPEPFPFDDWTARGTVVAPEAWRPLTTAQCRVMRAGGLIELGCHTHTHADFRGRPAEFAHDLRTSLDVFRERFGLRDATFAFPYGTRSTGFCGPEMAAVCRDAGLLCSLTTEEDLVQRGDDPFDWGRFGPIAADTADTLAAKLDGWHALLRGAWRRVRHPFDAARPKRSRTLTASSLPQRVR